MSSSTAEKTEQPTEKRLQDARKEGQVAKSQDLSSALLLIAVVAIVWLLGGYFGGMLQNSVKEQVEFAATFKGAFTQETVSDAMWRGLSAMIWLLTPLFLVVIVFAFLGNILQVGSVFSFQPVSPKFEKISPAGGIKQRFLGARPLIELGKMILKILIIALIAGLVLWSASGEIVSLIAKPPEIIAYYTFRLILEIGLKIGIALLFLGGMDFLLQRYLHRRDLRMTKSELREEHKETEGNPLIKSQRRNLHREILSKNLATAVRESSVVLTNPTHISVALKYENGKSNTPVIAAKGADLMAAHIRQIATDAGVPIKRDVSLAQALFEFEVEDEIPEEYFEAVAEVLQWVYSLRDEGRGMRDEYEN